METVLVHDRLAGGGRAQSNVLELARTVARSTVWAAGVLIFDHLPPWNSHPVRSTWLPGIIFAAIVVSLVEKKRRGWEWFFAFPPALACVALATSADRSAGWFLRGFSEVYFVRFRLLVCLFLVATTLWVAAFPYGRGFPGDEHIRSNAWKKLFWATGLILAIGQALTTFQVGQAREGTPIVVTFFWVVIWARRLGFLTYGFLCLRVMLPELVVRIEAVARPESASP